MLRISIRKTASEWFVLLWFYLLVFQRPLEDMAHCFVYLDEIFALLGIVILAFQMGENGRFRIKRMNLVVVLLLAGFVVVGLMGNLRYQYQSIAPVIVDLFTNLKFFLSILTGYILMNHCRIDMCSRMLLRSAKVVSLSLFVLLCMDYLFQIFPSDGYQYGLRAAQLIYGHPTYLAGATVFLLAILLLYYDKKNIPYMLMSVAILCATLRGKAFGGAVAFAVIIYYVVWQKKRIRWWHLLLLGIAGIAVGWENIAYYYVELSNESARHVLLTTSVQIMKDYFPIGTGFGTYASAEAMKHYSPVYFMYGINEIWGLSESYGRFGSDTFWPIIFGQTGFLGTVAYVSALGLLFVRILATRKVSIYAYAAGLFCFLYVAICSVAESAFHNSVAVALAMVIGFTLTDRRTHQ